MKASGIGGQAVIEGVMMKNKSDYAIAVRKPNNEIVVVTDHYHSRVERYSVLKLPIIRGIFAFIESMVVGMKTLTFSAGFYEEEDAKPTTVEKAINTLFREKAEAVVMTLTIMLATVMAIGIFMILPFFIAETLKGRVASNSVRALIEGGFRIGIFVFYVAAISQMKDIKRVFMYHGAEHKAINCIERGMELTVRNVRKQSKHHKRCGTSFMLIVMLVSIIFFIFINIENVWLRMLVRLLLVPIIAGISYEFIKIAGRSESVIMEILSKPGMWLQGLTTREPDDGMIEVAIQSVEAIFDWKGFLGLEKEKSKSMIMPKEKTVRTISSNSVVQEEKPIVAKQFTAKIEPAIKREPVVNIEPMIERDPIQEEDDTFTWVKPTLVTEPTKWVKPGKAVKPSKWVESIKPTRSSEKDNSLPVIDIGGFEEPKKKIVPPIKKKKNEFATPFFAGDDEEDDEILKALDKFFSYGKDEKKK